MSPHSRREFFKRAGAGAAASMTLATFPPAIRRALAIPAHHTTGTIKDVRHVVILMQENRSFDHYFGTLHGVRGFGDRFPIPVPGNRTVWQQRYTKDRISRIVQPFHLDARAGNAQRVAGTPHSYPDAQAAWDLGRMQAWPTHKQLHSMGHYAGAELEFQFALANAFTLCDAYHCAFHGGTNTNRLFHWSGTNDPAGLAGGPVIDNSGDSFDAEGGDYRWTTYPERLQAAGVSWKVYQNLPDNFTDNPLAGFRQYRAANRARGNPPKARDFPPYQATDEAISPLLKGIGNTLPDGGFLRALKEDIAAGALPQVSWIVAPAAYSEHPDPSSPVQGGWYTQAVLEALTADPAVWSQTVLLVNFDENDGFFDHLPPPCAPAREADGSLAGASTVATTGEYHTDGRPYGPGPRVPMYVVSPWSRGGWVNSQVFDHTSVLRFLEARFGVPEPNISAYRRAMTGDLTSAFNFATPNGAAPPRLPRQRKSAADAVRTAQEALPALTPPSEDSQRPPRQSTGTRPSRALPYELQVHARAAADGAMMLTFLNTGRAGAVFHVYDRLHLDRIPRRYAVEAGRQLGGAWDTAADDGRYDLWVLGPNGFHRHFQGDVRADSTLGVRSGYDVAAAALWVEVTNEGDRSRSLSIIANAYRHDGPWAAELAPGQCGQWRWTLSGQGHWYDFSVTAAPGLLYRLAGRLETGADGISDPAMGAA
ncbi:phosphocholine-specific phospholipase C [Pseudoxanthomonas sp.]|uniref:phosphocholine-specific phospholipase C n=1 Tax=Pseudoxanthomonas sp. TaxID=1871049 RepID=UPI003F7DCEB0